MATKAGEAPHDSSIQVMAQVASSPYNSRKRGATVQCLPELWNMFIAQDIDIYFFIYTSNIFIKKGEGDPIICGLPDLSGHINA